MIYEWRPVVGYEDIYEVRPGSDGGAVRRIKAAPRTRTGRELKSLSSGYPRAILSKPGYKPKHIRLHVLILEAFKGPCPEGSEGCHADDNYMNNSLENLYWGTRSDNLKDSIKNGRRNYVSILSKAWNTRRQNKAEKV